MRMEKKKEPTTAIETIFVIPRNQFYWGYRINEGAIHTETKENIFEFLKEFLPSPQYGKLASFLSRFRPFIILVKEEKLIELKKKEIDREFTRKLLEDEISQVMNFTNFKEKESSLDKKLEDIFQKVKK